jgi:hypothetical protein
MTNEHHQFKYCCAACRRQCKQLNNTQRSCDVPVWSSDWIFFRRLSWSHLNAFWRSPTVPKSAVSVAFRSEDGGSIFLGNIATYIPDYTASHTGRKKNVRNEGRENTHVFVSVRECAPSVSISRRMKQHYHQLSLCKFYSFDETKWN